MISLPPSFGEQLEEAFTASPKDGNVILGLVHPDSPWTIFLNRPQLEARGIRDEIVIHECTHADLLTSTAYGHIQQFFFVVSKALVTSHPLGFPRDINIYSRILYMLGCHLNKLCWNVHEGAAVALSTFVAQAQKAAEETSIQSFLGEHPQEYQAAYFSYATLWHDILAQLNLPPSVAYCLINATAQFCLNTNVIDHASDMLRDRITPGEFLELMTLGTESPDARLAMLNTVNKQELIARLAPRLENLRKKLAQQTPPLEQIEENDLINNLVLSVLDEMFPNYLRYYHSTDVLQAYRRVMKDLWLLEYIPLFHYDATTDRAKRRSFYHFADMT